MKLGPGRKKAYDAGLKKVGRPRKARPDDGFAVCPPGEAPSANRIITGDCIQTLNDGPEGWLDLVFADPPFNIGYLYHNYDDQKEVDEYVDWSEQWMRAVHRALKPSGSFYLAIGDEFAADLAVVARRRIGFHMRNWIIWHYTFGQQTKKMFAKSHTHILYFTKRKLETGPNATMPFTFNADAIRVASARQTTYADVRANPKGKLPDDTWYLRPQEAAPAAYFEPGGDTWNVSRVCGTFKEREGWHGCQMPIAILNRIILASSNPGDVVLDPFNGSGTTVVAAALLGRQYVGIDQSPEYVKFAQDRLAHALQHASRSDQLPALPSNGSVNTNRSGHDEAMLFQNAVAAASDPNRRSRMIPETDAFGRQRVPRGKTRTPR